MFFSSLLWLWQCPIRVVIFVRHLLWFQVCAHRKTNNNTCSLILQAKLWVDDLGTTVFHANLLFVNQICTWHSIVARATSNSCKIFLQARMTSPTRAAAVFIFMVLLVPERKFHPLTLMHGRTSLFQVFRIVAGPGITPSSSWLIKIFCQVVFIIMKVEERCSWLEYIAVGGAWNGERHFFICLEISEFVKYEWTYYSGWFNLIGVIQRREVRLTRITTPSIFNAKASWGV